ncbi:acyl-CoA dehydrogenase family protein [Nocardia fusca]|uniref:acyl-CoA dehydrogenase family protein n=1 Tax=Nocardia fusca TaxID=941183 RepID=UPI0007A75515|nr:acyl-CoA dehydrogenase family protein [Nocardia fusca]
MNFGFSDTQFELAGALDEVLADICGPGVLRAEWENPGSRLPAIWTSLGELGLLGLVVPEDAGGQGAACVDVALMFERCGRHAVPGPLVEHIVVVAPAVGGEDPAALLPGLLAGTTIATAAEPGRDEVRWAVESSAVLMPGAAGWVLAERPEALPAQRSVDRSVTYGTITLGEAGVTPLDGYTFSPAIERAAAVAVSAQLIGIAGHLIRSTVAYVRQRHQFGVPIGTQQAVKHKLADAVIALEHARPAVYAAAWQVDHDGATARRDVSHARVTAAEAAYLAARTALQCHGAIGYTWEHDLHLWFKRVLALSTAWGSMKFHRDILLREILGQEASATSASPPMANGQSHGR